MEEEFRIRRANVGFGTYLKIVLVLGFCMGLLFSAISILINFYELASGDPDVGIADFSLSLTVVVTGPLGMVVASILSFPIYRFVNNKCFSMSWSVFGEKDY